MCQYLNFKRPDYFIAKEMRYKDNRVTGIVHKYGQDIEIT